MGLGHIFGWSCALLCWCLGRTIAPPWAPNTLYLDKVLCVSCAPGAFAKTSLGQPCADFFGRNKRIVLNYIGTILIIVFSNSAIARSVLLLE